MKGKMLFLFLCWTITGQAQTFSLSSETLGGQFTNKGVFQGFGCTGSNESPQLRWENAPAGTKSFAITMYDPDAPTGSGWWHWVVFNIPASTKEVPANASADSKLPLWQAAIQGMTDYGMTAYGGPCPPEGHGDHQYLITVYALKVDKLDLDEKASPALVGYFLNSNALAKASIVSYFKR